MQRERDGTTGRTIAVENVRGIVRYLRGEYASLERDDLRLLVGVRNLVGFRMNERRIDRLARKTGFASVSHNRGQETEIGRRQRTAIHGYDTGGRAGEAGHWVGRAVVGILHARHCELQIRRRRQRYANSD